MVKSLTSSTAPHPPFDNWRNELAHLEQRRPRYEVDRARRREMTERFLAASALGDLNALARLLAQDAKLISDSGGKAKAPLHVITGASKVSRFLIAMATEQAAQAFVPSAGSFSFAITDVNAAPALVVYADTRPVMVISLAIADGLIGGRARTTAPPYRANDGTLSSTLMARRFVG